MRHSRRIALTLAAAALVSAHLARAPASGGDAAAGATAASAAAPGSAAGPGTQGETRSAGRGAALATAASASPPAAAAHTEDLRTGELRVAAGAASAEREAVAGDRHAGEETPPAPELDPVDVPAGSVTASVSGWDPAAPRVLTLWRVENGRFARLAGTRSEPGGGFRFAQVAVAGRELAVAPGDREPAAQATRVVVPAADARPPGAQVVGQAEGEPRLRVFPSAQAAAVVFASGGRVVGRRAVAPAPSARERMLELPVGAGAPAADLYVAEERADGARSPWLRVDPGAPEEASGAEHTR